MTFEKDKGKTTLDNKTTQGIKPGSTQQQGGRPQQQQPGQGGRQQQPGQPYQKPLDKEKDEKGGKGTF